MEENGAFITMPNNQDDLNSNLEKKARVLDDIVATIATLQLSPDVSSDNIVRKIRQLLEGGGYLPR